jgi:hypothetical protein
MRIKTRMAVALCAPLLTIAAAGTASAGEVTGPPGDGFATGHTTPIAGYVANSICAFSGLNMYHPGKDPVYPVVQSYGMFVRAGLKEVAPSPGDACNGHTGELAGP